MPTAYYERLAIVERWERHVKRAITYLGNARYALRIRIDESPLLRFVPTQYWKLLDESLETALAIVEALPDDFFAEEEVEDFFGLRATLGVSGSMKYNASDDPYETAQKVVAVIERRRGHGKTLRRIKALENTGGRTPEEAAAYRAKAAEMRERLNSGSLS